MNRLYREKGVLLGIAIALIAAGFLVVPSSASSADLDPCKYLVCQDENTTTSPKGCACGTEVTNVQKPYCWAEGNQVFADPDTCKAAIAAAAAELPSGIYRLPGETQVPGTGKALIKRIEIIANWVFAFFLAISLIYIVIGAFQFVTGGGDPAQVSGARQKLIYAAIGIAIGLLVFAIPRIVRDIVLVG